MAVDKDIIGKVWKLGDHVNTDVLHPPAFFSLDETRMHEGLQAGMERLGRRDKGNSSGEGIVIIGGENLGCGSSRETSVRALKAGNVRAVIAKSFARIFFRSLANLGIPPLVCPEIHDHAEEGEEVCISFAEGVAALGGEQRFPFAPLDLHIQQILACGGLIPYLRREHNGL